MRKPVFCRAPAVGTLVVLSLAAFPAWAHAFGVRYDLPLPLGLYLLGAGATVALSFLIMALFLRRLGRDQETTRLDLTAIPACSWLGSGPLLNLFRGCSVMVFGLILAACFAGNPQPFHNIAPTFVWVIWWVGMAFVSALAGDLWALLNPWAILFGWARRRPLGASPPRPYPQRLGHWPALVLFLVFAWLELISETGEKPRILGVLILIYSGITWTGMVRYGRAAWLRYGEVFSVVFGLLARFAPSAVVDGRWVLRFPAVGLLSRRPVPFSTVCLVLLLLTTVTFDGILETPLWADILDWIAENQALRPALIALQNNGVNLIIVIKSVALLALPCVFAAVYLFTAVLIARCGGGGVSRADIAGYFVLTLVPIAIAYHLSHYLSYLLIAGQNIIALVSDPFGVGWDLFGTANHAIDLGIVNAKMVWYVAVSAIVIGHVAAVYIAHVMALRVFAQPARALWSQAPMLVLMVGYTMISLWILSQPVVS